MNYLYLCKVYTSFYAVEQDNLRLLSKIQYPEDLRQLKVDELPQGCDELRQDIVQELQGRGNGEHVQETFQQQKGNEDTCIGRHHLIVIDSECCAEVV